MNKGRYLFAQIKEFIPRYEFDKLVTKYNGYFHVKDLTCYNQLLHLLFGQLTGCESLREIGFYNYIYKHKTGDLGIRQVQQRCRKDAHAVRSARQYSCKHTYYRRQIA